MATTLEDLTTGIKNRLATIAGLRVNAVEPASVTPPAAWPFLRAAEYDQTFDGGMRWQFSIYILIALADNQYGQTNLMPYLEPVGTKSIKAALEGEMTLGGVADSCRVTRIDGVGSYAVAGGNFLGAVLILEVLT